jgi:hypothetical protein
MALDRQGLKRVRVHPQRKALRWQELDASQEHAHRPGSHRVQNPLLYGQASAERVVVPTPPWLDPVQLEAVQGQRERG